MFPSRTFLSLSVKTRGFCHGGKAGLGLEYRVSTYPYAATWRRHRMKARPDAKKEPWNIVLAALEVGHFTASLTSFVIFAESEPASTQTVERSSTAALQTALDSYILQSPA